MKVKAHFDFFGVILLPFLLVFSLWFVYWVELRFALNFNDYGVRPRSFIGLRGVLFSPFIHSGVEHLYNNSIPLFVLLSALFYFYKNIRFKILFWGFVGTGILTWIIGRESYHIGASGIVYLLTSFLFFKGIWSRNFRLIALSLIVVFLYGSMVWGIFPQKEHISWEGHLSGMLVGLLLALIYKPPATSVTTYEWEKPNYEETKDAFLAQFDAHGNFIPASDLEDKSDDLPNHTLSCTEDVQVEYTIKHKK